MEFYTLNNGVLIPKVGMGGWAQSKETILDAIKNGYTLIDTAAQYGNEEAVGEAIKESGVLRDKLFVCTKLWTDDIREHRTEKAFYESLSRLGLDYIDLFLIHWPAFGFEDAYIIMEDLYKKGYIRAIGVSNFEPHHLSALTEYGACVVPAVNQIELHPYFLNADSSEFSKNIGTYVEAWCPLGGPRSGELSDNVIKEISIKYHKTEAQVILRWHIQRNIIAIPKTSHIDRMKSNIEVFDFELTEEEITRITELDSGRRLGAHPDSFKF